MMAVCRSMITAGGGSVHLLPSDVDVFSAFDTFWLRPAVALPSFCCMALASRALKLMVVTIEFHDLFRFA